jgi:chromate reductase, NAD(P)H dehydrogenase (quinone)
VAASQPVIRILAISGSLRASSSNTALLQAAAASAPQGIEVSLYDGLGELPHFNPDLDSETPPAAVARWRSALVSADGVVFSVPEYAHGVPGVLKNSLDWVVGSGELVNKPVTLFNASARGTYAQASLTETLTVMSAKVVHEASVTADPGMTAAVRSALDAFARAILNSSSPRE